MRSNKFESFEKTMSKFHITSSFNERKNIWKITDIFVDSSNVFDNAKIFAYVNISENVKRYARMCIVFFCKIGRKNALNFLVNRYSMYSTLSQPM